MAQFGLSMNMGFHQQQLVNIRCCLGQLVIGFKLLLSIQLDLFRMIPHAEYFSGWLELPTRQQHTNIQILANSINSNFSCNALIRLRSGNDLCH
jgi:hypothetical protein